MIQYPSIQSYKAAPKGEPCYSFVKYDGSNLRWEWSPKRGWYKFGTRHTMFDSSHSQFGDAIDIFMNVHGKEIASRVQDRYGRQERIVAFTEYHGPSSFAGWHDPDEAKTLTLFDVHLFKKGFMKPKDFVEVFTGHRDVAELHYVGNMNDDYIKNVRNDVISLKEGVVCKGASWSAKIKTEAWLNRLKGKFGDEWEKYE